MESCQCMGFMCTTCQSKICDKWSLMPKYANEIEKSHQEGRDGIKKLIVEILKKSDKQYYSHDDIISLVMNL